MVWQIHGALGEYERTLITEPMRCVWQQKYQADTLLPWDESGSRPKLNIIVTNCKLAKLPLL